ncbi:hypothetical protein KPC83_02935 [Collinsella sp. zg1085]|uniref:hypothetical protein n=1 Tax=Collinsella sp. zg1085 TaxID=2844380 RepID=UPI001C0DF4D4|nr:hypothetical protein [Collinsella sp. zg1085]QWT18100.1 hypothetical protein KPC83_02935 [Collinsella sp. zg1085]
MFGASLIAGERVVVLHPVVQRDRLGDILSERIEREHVENVVVAPSPTDDLDPSRPQGSRRAYTLCFPKTYTADLQGAQIEVRGQICRVIGSPRRYTESNVPGPWNLTVDVEHIDG